MIRALVFDLCDTVVHTAGAQALLALPGLENGATAHLEAWFKGDALFVEYERGGVDTPTFLRHFRQKWQVQADLEELRLAYEGLIVKEIEGMGALLAEMAATFTLFALSNNNPLLWRGIERVCNGLGHFEQIFLSHQIGALKPEAAAFDYVLKNSGYSADEVVLIDDNPACVAGAQKRGWGAIHFTSAQQTRRALKRILTEQK